MKDHPSPELDPAVYSPLSVLVHADDGSSYWRRQTWQELAEEREAEIDRLRPFQRIVLDLGRNANGRHEGDADVGDPTGVSQGNPRLRAGDVLGYGINGGVRYVMPPRELRHDPAAWIVPPVSRTLAVVRKARKPHHCDTCRGTIEPGALYRDARLPPGHEDVGNRHWMRSTSHVEGGCPAYA